MWFLASFLNHYAKLALIVENTTGILKKLQKWHSLKDENWIVAFLPNLME